jgi:hypothetical protein
MSATICDVTVHIDESLNDRELVNLEQAIRSDEGVVSVGHNEKDRHLVMVLYDAKEIRGKDILNRVSGQGFHGELIGFL